MEKYSVVAKEEHKVEYYSENGKPSFIRDGIKNTFTNWDENGKRIER